MSATRRGSRVAAGGFTLVEVLVAVAILALALGTFISGGARYADQARYLQDRTLALWVARNRMVEYQLAASWPDTGRSDGEAEMGGRKWEWRAEVTESPDPAVRRIDITVHRIDPGTGDVSDDSVATLSGFVTENGGPLPTSGVGSSGIGS